MERHLTTARIYSACVNEEKYRYHFGEPDVKLDQQQQQRRKILENQSSPVDFFNMIIIPTVGGVSTLVFFVLFLFRKTFNLSTAVGSSASHAQSLAVCFHGVH